MVSSVYSCTYNEMRRPPDEYDFSRARRGAVVPAKPGKTRITIRIDGDILQWFHDQVDSEGGGNYQSSINRALRSFMEESRQPLEAMLRRVIREELAREKRRN